MKKTIAIATLCMSAHVSAANCAAPTTQVDMTSCARQEYGLQDKRLNALYSQYRLRLGEPQKTQLKDAQLAWIRFRDLACAFESSATEGGSAVQLVRYRCLAEKTRARLEDIRKLHSCKEGDLLCQPR